MLQPETCSSSSSSSDGKRILFNKLFLKLWQVFFSPIFSVVASPAKLTIIQISYFDKISFFRRQLLRYFPKADHKILLKPSDVKRSETQKGLEISRENKLEISAKLLQ